MIALLLLTLLQPAVSGLRPDLSPGEAKPMTREQICQQAYVPDASSNVPSTLWAEVLQRYGLSWADRYSYDVSLVVPSALGGIVTVRNVFPLPKVGPWDRPRKIAVEQRAFEDFCAGRIFLPEAQNLSGTAWGHGMASIFCQVSDPRVRPSRTMPRKAGAARQNALPAAQCVGRVGLYREAFESV